MNRKKGFYFIFLLIIIPFILLSEDSWTATKKKKKVEDEVPQPRSSPWVLRHRYTFSWENMGIDFDELNGDWHIYYTVPDNYSEMTVIEGYGPSVQLKSGEEITAESCGNAITDRESIDSVFGSATHFIATFPIKNNLLIQQRVTSFKQCSFVLFTTLITNKGNTPITISKIKPLAFPPLGGLITRLPNERIVRPLANIYGCWTFVSEENSQILEVTTQNDQKIIFAVCPQGKSHSKIVTLGEGDNWTGAIECEYLPCITLAPGETLESDPIFVSFSNDAYKLHTTLAWAISLLSPTNSKITSGKPIRGWISVNPEKATLANLDKLANFSSGIGINAVVIPSSWEQPLGSLKGNSKIMSKDMKSVIDQLKNHGSVKVGLTLNPWVVPPGTEHSIPVSNEYAFVRLNTPEGLEIAKKRWEKVQAWNPDFIICDISVPDTLLEQLNITSTESMFRGIKELSAYFVNIPIYPKISDRIINTEEELVQFCALAGTLAGFKTGMSPVKINNQLLKNLNFHTHLFLQSFPGPIVWVGEFNNAEITQKINQFALETKVNFSPIDANKKLPFIWHFRSYSQEDSFSNSLIYVAKDVEPFPVSMLKTISSNALFWDFNNEKFLADNETIQGNPENKFIGVVFNKEVPSVVGIKGENQCGLEFIYSTKWENEKKRLEISLKETLTLPATLYIYKPEKFKILKVVVNDKPLKSVKLNQNMICIPFKSRPEKVELVVE